MNSVDTVVALWVSSRRAIAQVERDLDALLTAELGLPFTTYAVLCTIAELPRRPVTQQAIADSLGLDKSSVSRQVETAVRSGHLSAESSTESRRSKAIDLTPQGESDFRKANILLAEFTKQLNLEHAPETIRFMNELRG